MKEKTILEQYIETDAFKRHVNNVIFKLDRNRKYIDDIIQDFCLYYAARPNKAPNARKLYNLMITKLKYEKRYVLFDVNELYAEIEKIYDDKMIP
jgi:hypothetical protein